MKKLLTAVILSALITPVFSGVIKESQAKREVDDAIQALAAMDARADLSNYVPQKEAYSARTYCNKARNFLGDSEYDKASFYAVLSTNYSKISLHKGLLAKAEHDKLETAAQGALIPRLKNAGMKPKGSSGIFTGVADLKAMYAVKRAPKLDEIPALSPDMAERMTTILGVMLQQKDVKIAIAARAKNEELAEKYAKSLMDVLIEKGVDVARIEYTTKKGRDGVEITMSGVKIQ
jgi:hypothetical protein